MKRPTRYDPADPLQREQRQADQDLAMQQRRADWAWLAADPRGRRIAADLVALSGYLGPSFNADPLRMAYAEGAREIGARVQAALMDVSEAVSAAVIAEVLKATHVRNDDRRTG